MSTAARITSFLVKVASRCNLDCDYCYVYHHADQSWRDMPRLLSATHRQAFALRVAEYAQMARLDRCAVIFHGGEPLLAGAQSLVSFAGLIREAAPSLEIDFGLQTNGLLLSEEVLDLLEVAGIAVSLSMDGPREVHDLHRTTRRGRSSFDRVASALDRLKARPAIFAGVIAVVDASVPPAVLLEFFAAHRVPKFDFLLPDAHHDRPPPGRDGDPGLYERWLIQAFDLWFDRHPELPVRTFEALLDAAAGLPAGTDAFGFGDVSLLSVETDGSWHDLDVLKVAGDGASRLTGSVLDTSIAELALSEAVASHRRLLSKPGLSDQCRTCDVVEVCGGGSVPHRFGSGGFRNPTVYCREMKALITHVRHRLFESLSAVDPEVDVVPTVDLSTFEVAETSAKITEALAAEALSDDLAGLEEAFELCGLPLHSSSGASMRGLARRAGTIAWQRAVRACREGRIIHDVEGRPMAADALYGATLLNLRLDGDLEVGVEDPWLRRPFGCAIEFEDSEVAERGRGLIREALAIVEAWRPALARELAAICSAVQFVRDPSAHPDKIVSFSDDSVPGAIYVSIRGAHGMIDAYDLADSLVHEYRHQKLYLLERRHSTTRPGALVVSPWRDDLRPASGLLHAAFVFVELRRFWQHVRDQGPARLGNRAVAQLEDTERNLTQAFETLRTCDLTSTGRSLAQVLEGSVRPVALVA